MSNIRLSEKHGVNPSVLVCPFCGQDTGVLLAGRLKGDEEAPHRTADVEVCKECRDFARQGVVLREREGSMVTGRVWVITPESFRKIFVDVDPGTRMCHIDGETAKAVGLPYEEDVEESD